MISSAIKKHETDDFGRYSIHVAVALALICSLTAVAIISKKNFANHLWADLAALAVPIPITVYFRNQIVQLGNFTHAAIFILVLGAAVLFGI